VIIKVCQFKACPEQGERLVEVFTPGDMAKAAEFFAMGKTAAPLLPEVQHYLDKLKPHPNKIYVLVNALGAGEYWGSNINGDYFPEGSLIHKGPVYGYETFYQAFPYKHHVNKDPSKSFGKVELSVWHNDMKRVELVVCIDRDLAARFAAQDICDKLDHGMFPDVSMGCKVPYDLCSKCTDWEKYRRAQSTFNPDRHRSVGQAVLEFHKKDPIRGVSITRNDYCSHLKTQLNRILDDGVKIYAVNDYPRFFDISFVFIGADKTAKVMAKLAHRTFFDVVPSWYVAEQLGYDSVPVDKDFEKAAAAPVSELEVLGKDIVRGVARRYSPDNLSTKRVSQVIKKVDELHRKTEAPQEKTASLSSVRAKLREKRASHRKGAEITKEVVPSQFGGKAVPADHNAPDLPNEVLDLLGKFPMHEALSTPTSMGMLLRPREFQRITIISIGRKDLADKMDGEGLQFPHTDEKDTSIPVGGEHFSEAIKKLLLPFMEGRSAFEPIARRRVVKITIMKPEEGQKEPPKGHEKVAQETPFLLKISAAYNGYLDRAMDCFREAPNVINNNSDLWEAVFRSGLSDGFSKEAAGGQIDPAVLLGTVGGAYLLSQYARNQRDKSYMGLRDPVGLATNFAADHPNLLMLLAGMGALYQQGSPIPSKIVKGIGSVLNNPKMPTLR
jgi:hypothetical protein